MAEESSDPTSIVVDPQPSASAPTPTPPTVTVKEPDINIGAVSTYKIEPLKEGNWVAWRSRMMTILKFQHAYGFIEGTVPKPADPEG